jgi:hypothetical protein
VLDDQDRALVGEQWLSGWRQILAERMRRDFSHQDTGGAEAGSRSWSPAWERLANPPTLSSLADRPELRIAVTATFAEVGRWVLPSPPTTQIVSVLHQCVFHHARHPRRHRRAPTSTDEHRRVKAVHAHLSANK